MEKYIQLLFFICLPFIGITQTYPDHFGKGQYNGLSVSSSHEMANNLALNKPTSQSSNYAGNFLSNKVNDGNINTFNATTYEANAWWEVDLGAVAIIRNIEIYNRINCCPERLDNSYIFVSDVPFTTANFDTTRRQATVDSYHIETAGDTINLAINRTGRYLRIQLAGTNYLNISEFRVLGALAQNSALSTLNGAAMMPDMAAASRFLSQATLGYNYEEIEYVNQIGIDAWLEEQFNMPPKSFLEQHLKMTNDVNTVVQHPYDLDYRHYLSFTFYQTLLERPDDALRFKVANALSQILVMSAKEFGIFFNRTYGAADYYDILYLNAFGNYQDILHDISYHVSMGAYLSSYQNRKADFGLGTQPDENYAREIMQLFSIGLNELNNDGTEKLDADGNPIPTYDNEDIRNLARVFTGLGGSATGFPNYPSLPVNFDLSFKHSNYTIPMTMYEDYHDTNEKTLVDGTILPAGRSGYEDINDAIDALFNHPNVGPFISIRLIQQLVKSNPSPAYVNRVANAFNNNGSGIRGDLGAVVEAILMDPEARDCTLLDDPKAGKLIQPLERYTNLLLAFGVNTPSGRFWFRDDQVFDFKTKQSFMRPPSVFNYYSPFYAEGDYVAANDMVSPEFQILNATSGIYYMNIIEDALKVRPFDNHTINDPNFNDGFLTTQYNPDDDPVIELGDEINIVNTQGLSALLDRLDILLCRGHLSSGTRTIIENTITQYQNNVPGYSTEDAVKDAIYFIMVSPDYTIRI